MNFAFEKHTASPRMAHKAIEIGLSAIVLLALALPAQADNLVLNGGFQTTTVKSATNASNSNGGEMGYNLNATDWTTSGYNFLYTSAAAATSGAEGQYGIVALDAGSSPTLTASPAGGNFIAADGNKGVGAITQTITGLTAGDTYQLTFYWAGAQQYGSAFTGVTTDQWQVSLGTQTFDTAVLTDPSHGFTGWESASFDYTATSSTEVLSFLSVGTGAPPFALLDGVSLEQVVTPEPSTLPLLLTGLIGILGVFRARNWRKGTL